MGDSFAVEQKTVKSFPVSKWQVSSQQTTLLVLVMTMVLKFWFTSDLTLLVLKVNHSTLKLREEKKEGPTVAAGDLLVEANAMLSVKPRC